MNREEIKDYLKRVDKLELKLTGEDKDTYQWVLFGYNKCAGLLNEKEHILKELRNWLEDWIENEEYCYLASNVVDRCRQEVYREVLDKLNELEGKND